MRMSAFSIEDIEDEIARELEELGSIISDNESSSTVETESMTSAESEFSLPNALKEQLECQNNYYSEFSKELRECDEVLTNCNRAIQELDNSKTSEELEKIANEDGFDAEMLKEKLLHDIELLESRVDLCSASDELTPLHQDVIEIPSIDSEITEVFSIRSEVTLENLDSNRTIDFSTGRMSQLANEWKKYLDELDQDSFTQFSFVDMELLEWEGMQKLIDLHRRQKLLEDKRKATSKELQDQLMVKIQEIEAKRQERKSALSQEEEVINENREKLKIAVDEDEKYFKETIKQLSVEFEHKMASLKHLRNTEEKNLEDLLKTIREEKEKREINGAVTIQRHFRGFLSRRRYGLLIKMRKKKMMEWRKMRDADRVAEIAHRMKLEAKKKENLKKQKRAEMEEQRLRKEEEQREEEEAARERKLLEEQKAIAEKEKLAKEKENRVQQLKARANAEKHEKEKLEQECNDILSKVKEELKLNVVDFGSNLKTPADVSLSKFSSKIQKLNNKYTGSSQSSKIENSRFSDTKEREVQDITSVYNRELVVDDNLKSYMQDHHTPQCEDQTDIGITKRASDYNISCTQLDPNAIVKYSATLCDATDSIEVAPSSKLNNRVSIDINESSQAEDQDHPADSNVFSTDTVSFEQKIADVKEIENINVENDLTAIKSKESLELNPLPATTLEENPKTKLTGLEEVQNNNTAFDYCPIKDSAANENSIKEMENVTGSINPQIDSVAKIAENAESMETRDVFSVHNEISDVDVDLLKPLNAVVESRRLQWIKDCIPWKDNCSSWIDPKPSRKSSSKKLNNLPKDLILQNAFLATSLLDVNTVVLRDLPGYTLSSLNECPNLKYLIVENAISAVHDISQCNQLQYINITHNKLIDSSFGNLSSLTRVGLSHNSLSRIPDFSGCANLKYLDLSFNSITRLGKGIGLEGLQYFKLAHNQLIHTRGIGKMTRLTYLDISHNNVSSLDEVEMLGLLQYFDASHNNLSEIPRNCNQILLRYLDLSCNYISLISPLSIGFLPCLEMINLKQNRIESFSPLKSCICLKALDVSDNLIAEVNTVRECVSWLPSLEKLNITNNPCTSHRSLSFDADDSNVELLENGVYKFSKISEPDVSLFERICDAFNSKMSSISSQFSKLESDYSPKANNDDFLDSWTNFIVTNHLFAMQQRRSFELGLMQDCNTFTFGEFNDHQETSAEDIFDLKSFDTINNQPAEHSSNFNAHCPEDSIISEKHRPFSPSKLHSQVMGKKMLLDSRETRQNCFSNASSLEVCDRMETQSKHAMESQNTLNMRSVWNSLKATNHDMAAVKIQANWRGFWLRKVFRKIMDDIAVNQVASEESELEEIDLNEFNFDLDKIELPKTPVATDIDIQKESTSRSPDEDSCLPLTLNDTFMSSSSTTFRNSSLASSRKAEAISEDWGFKSGLTAELMVRRAKKMNRKTRVLGPEEKLALLRKKEQKENIKTLKPVKKVQSRGDCFKPQNIEFDPSESNRVTRTLDWVNSSSSTSKPPLQQNEQPLKLFSMQSSDILRTGPPRSIGSLHSDRMELASISSCSSNSPSVDSIRRRNQVLPPIQKRSKRNLLK